MIVRYLTTDRPHLGTYAGLPRFIAYLDSQRVRARVRYVANGDDDFIKLFPFIPAPLRTRWRHRTQRRGQYWYKLSDLVAEGASLLECLTDSVDVVHFIDGEHTAQFLPALARRLGLGVRTIATYHQTPAILQSIVVPEVVAQLDHVTLLATAQREWFAPFLPSERMSVILHGVDTTFFTPGDVRDQGGPFRCITTGSWQRDWSIVEAVASMLRDHDIVFDVVSGAASSFEGLPNVRVHRGISDDALRALYQAAHVLLLPLTDAAANNALLEGMASGLAIVATDLPAVREYAPTSAAVTVPHHAEAFTAEILRLRDDQPTRARLAANARARALELSWDNVARAYEALYRRLVRSAPGART